MHLGARDQCCGDGDWRDEDSGPSCARAFARLPRLPGLNHLTRLGVVRPESCNLLASRAVLVDCGRCLQGRMVCKECQGWGHGSATLRMQRGRMRERCLPYGAWSLQDMVA
eukprot:1443396-Amphidinium_carterae.1